MGKNISSIPDEDGSLHYLVHIAKVITAGFTTKERGSGMVLVLGCKGFIEVESEPGHGCTFRVFISALEKDHEDRLTPEKPKQQKPLPLGTERILIVNDDPLLVRINQRLLDRGYRQPRGP